MNRYFTFAFAMLALMGMISHSAMADPIADRNENFRNNVKSLKLIQPALAAGDMDVISGEANPIRMESNSSDGD